MAGNLMRTWEDAQGVQIDAELVRVEGEVVYFRKGGRIVRVLLESLSQADQEFIAARQAPPTLRTRTQETSTQGSSIRAERGNKKGLGISTGRHADWGERLEMLNVAWFYNWTSREPNDVPEGIEFVPMIFGREGHTQRQVDRIRREKETRGYRYVLGHNEPDSPRQANRTVEEVLDDWPTLMEIDLPLVSPGAIHPDREWMTSFMSGVDERGLRVDFIAVHSYGGPDARAFLNRLDRIHRMYRRPIWITEFAVGDWRAETVEDNRYSQREILAFMRSVLPELERRSYIYRYAWYPARPDNPALGTSALFNEDGSLTPLGEYYSRTH